jgi:hypothetical protein
LDGLSGAAGGFLNTLGDQVAGGADLFGGALGDGAQLAASSLIAAACLLASGLADGADSFGQVIEGLANAAGGLGFDPGDGTFSLPGIDAFSNAFGNLAGGLSAAGGTFLDALGDGTLSGADLFNNGVEGGADLAASSLLSLACLLTAGASGGGSALAQAIWALSGATWDLGDLGWDVAGSLGDAIPLPGADVLANAFGNLAGGLSAAGGSFLDMLGDGVSSGTDLFNNGVETGANLAASSLLSLACLLTSGASGGASALAQAIWGLSGATWDLGDLGWGLSGGLDGIPLPGVDALPDIIGNIVGGLSGLPGPILDNLGAGIDFGSDLAGNLVGAGVPLAQASLNNLADLIAADVAFKFNLFNLFTGGLSDVAAGLGSPLEVSPVAPVAAAISDVASGIPGASANLTVAVEAAANGMANASLAASASLAAATPGFGAGTTSSLQSANSIPSASARLVQIATPTEETSNAPASGAPATDNSASTASAPDSSKDASAADSQAKKADSDKSAKASTGGKHRASSGKGKHAK